MSVPEWLDLAREGVSGDPLFRAMCLAVIAVGGLQASSLEGELKQRAAAVIFGVGAAISVIQHFAGCSLR